MEVVIISSVVVVVVAMSIIVVIIIVHTIPMTILRFIEEFLKKLNKYPP